MKARKLSDFIKPLPSEPLNLTTPATTPEPARDETPTLPELKTGDIISNKKNVFWRVVRVHNPRRDTGYDEPLFRLSKITKIEILGHGEYTLDELQDAGMKLEGN